MDRSVQDIPAAPSPCQYTCTLKVLSNSLPGQYSNTHFAKLFFNRHVASYAVSTSTGISGCFQPGQAKVVLGPTFLGHPSLVSLSENLLDGLWEAEEVRVEAQQEEEVESGEAGGTVLHNTRPGTQRQPASK